MKKKCKNCKNRFETNERLNKKFCSVECEYLWDKKNMKINLRIGAFVFFSILYLLIVFLSSLYVHELTHKFQYRDIDKKNESICVFIFEKCDLHDGINYFGYYHFEAIDEEGYEKALKISETQEIGAYSVQTIYLIIMYGLGILFYIFQNKKSNILKGD